MGRARVQGRGWRGAGPDASGVTPFLVDVDECATAGRCQHGQCANTHGGYTCVCPDGFLLDSSRSSCICEPPGSEAGPVSTLSSWLSIPGSNSLRPHPPRSSQIPWSRPTPHPPSHWYLPFRTSQTTLWSLFGSSKNPSNLLNSDLQTFISSSQAPIFPHLSRYFRC